MDGKGEAGGLVVQSAADWSNELPLRNG